MTAAADPKAVGAGRPGEFHDVPPPIRSSVPGVIKVSGLSFSDRVAAADPNNVQEVAASQLEISNSYYRSVLDQAKSSFRMAIIGAGIGVAFFLAAVLIAIWRNNAGAASLSAVAGGIVECVAGLNFWLYGRTAKQLDAFHRRIERTQGILLGNSISSGISQPERDRVRARIIEAAISGEAFIAASTDTPVEGNSS